MFRVFMSGELLLFYAFLFFQVPNVEINDLGPNPDHETEFLKLSATTENSAQIEIGYF